MGGEATFSGKLEENNSSEAMVAEKKCYIMQGQQEYSELLCRVLNKSINHFETGTGPRKGKPTFTNQTSPKYERHVQNTRI